MKTKENNQLKELSEIYHLGMGTASEALIWFLGIFFPKADLQGNQWDPSRTYIPGLESVGVSGTLYCRGRSEANFSAAGHLK